MAADKEEAVFIQRNFYDCWIVVKYRAHWVFPINLKRDIVGLFIDDIMADPSKFYNYSRLTMSVLDKR